MTQTPAEGPLTELGRAALEILAKPDATPAQRLGTLAFRAESFRLGRPIIRREEGGPWIEVAP